MTAGWCARTARAAVFAAVCTVLAALGHVMTSGHHLTAPALLAGWAATGAAGWCLAGRERGLPLVASGVVAAQTALHGVFSLTGHGGAATAAPPSGDTGAAAPHPAAMVRGALTASPDHLAPLGHAGHAPPAADGSAALGMAAAHLPAALLCGLWLGYGERAVFRALRAVAGLLAAPLRLPLAAPALPRRPPAR
ncbi:hypothetical protein, partial [Streptomyces glaucus]|uniref:hypothetical protein n=1 Tax=Streptomyces glaucus TaxID=284029 RepID=UPI0031D978CB